MGVYWRGDLVCGVLLNSVVGKGMLLMANLLFMGIYCFRKIGLLNNIIRVEVRGGGGGL